MLHSNRVNSLGQLLILLSLCACRSQKDITLTSGFSPSPDRIAFLTLRITHEDSNSSRITLLDKSITLGKYKSKSVERSIEPDFLTIRLTDHDSVVYSLTLDHPLFRNVEYIDSLGHLATKSVELPESEFFFRLPVHTSHPVVHVYETLHGDPEKELRSFELLP